MEARYWLQKAAFEGNSKLAAIYWARHHFYMALAGLADEAIHWQKAPRLTPFK